jgi:hypothetical protein
MLVVIEFRRLRAETERKTMNNLAAHQFLLDDLTPWAGAVPRGYIVDFMGTLTDVEFQPKSRLAPSDVGGGHVETKVPDFGNGGNGEWWFEAVNWLASAREARDRYVMITLGAHYGAQAVGAYRALQLVNPLPCKLVAVEAEPDNFRHMIRFFRDNDIDPDAHWLVPLAISDTNNPVFFPVGAPGVGANNCVATNEPLARVSYAEEIIAGGKAEQALENLLINNTTGIIKPVHPGLEDMTEIKCVSAVTLGDLVGAFDIVDYVESDIQQSEILAFPPFIDVLWAKVRRIHIGTHGRDTHRALHKLFEKNGWEIVFSFEPNARYESDLGPFELNDGVLTASNPDLRAESRRPSAAARLSVRRPCPVRSAVRPSSWPAAASNLRTEG